MLTSRRVLIIIWYNLNVFWQFTSDLKLIQRRCVWKSARVQCAGTRRLRRTSALWFVLSVTVGTGFGGEQVRNYQSKHPQLRLVHAAILLSVINFINKFLNFENSRHLQLIFIYFATLLILLAVFLDPVVYAKRVAYN